MSRFNGDMRDANSAVETLNAAANAIAIAEARAPPDTSQKKRWSSWLRAYWCFRPQKHNKRIGSSILVPEPPSSSTLTSSTPARNLIIPTSMATHFTAPPSSPASFNPSEPPSASQSPAGILSFTSIPDGPRSIFSIGPYAHETQLVSPPTFSTYTTEPSTAPFTPPPESVLLTTTPSSPEVPFAQFLDLNHRFQYDPAAHLSSATSSPLPDHELFSRGPYNRDIRFGFPPTLLNLHLLPAWGSGQECGAADSVVDENENRESPSQRVSFEDVVVDEDEKSSTVTDAKQKPQRQRSASLGSIKEFNFDNVNREPHKPCLGPNWWTSEETEQGTKNWSFFTVAQPGAN